MKKLIILFTVLAFCFTLPGLVGAAAFDSHTVDVSISAVNEIDVNGNVTLAINSATAGSDLDDAVDNTSADLAWTSNVSGNVIKVKSSLATINIPLTVQGINISAGAGSPTSPSAVTITNSDQTVITGVGGSYGTCNLEYTASGSVTAGAPVSDSHTITYTITAGP